MTTETAPRLGWTFHTFAVAFVAVATSVLFLREPGSGDEVTDWNLAFDLHEIGGHAWSIKSFHDLRWPMWGSIWLWQSVFGPGLASLYGPAFAFLAGTSAYLLGQRLGDRRALAKTSSRAV